MHLTDRMRYADYSYQPIALVGHFVEKKMSKLITINLTNNSPSLQNFFFFQHPANYTGGEQIYSNSLFTAPCLPYASSGASVSFWTDVQFYAGAQQQIFPPTVGQSSGQLSAIQPIGLTPPVGGTPTNNTTNMIVQPSLGLTPPSSTTGPQPGAFRIVTPIYNPISTYNAGTAVKTLTGTITLSSFVTARPNSNLDIQPTLKFYVAAGTYTPGTVMNFTSSSVSAAICDATTGYTTFNVSYNADGTWTVRPFALVRAMDDRPLLVPNDQALNVDILDEAGRALICQGFSANPNPPITIQNLTNPGALHVNDEYQIRPTGQQVFGGLCTSIKGNVGVFY